MIMNIQEIKIRVGDIPYKRFNNHVILFMEDYHIDSVMAAIEDDTYGEIETKFNYHVDNKQLTLLRNDQRVLGSTVVGRIPLTDNSVKDLKFIIRYYSVVEWRNNRLNQIGL